MDIAEAIYPSLRSERNLLWSYSPPHPSPSGDLALCWNKPVNLRIMTVLCLQRCLCNIVCYLSACIQEWVEASLRCLEGLRHTLYIYCTVSLWSGKPALPNSLRVQGSSPTAPLLQLKLTSINWGNSQWHWKMCATMSFAFRRIWWCGICECYLIFSSAGQHYNTQQPKSKEGGVTCWL